MQVARWARPEENEVAVPHDAPDVARQWRYYRGPQAEDPVRAYLAGLQRGDAMVLRARMHQVRRQIKNGPAVAPGIFEVRGSRGGQSHAVLFGLGGRGGKDLVALDAYAPTGKRTPRAHITTAQDRLARWRARGDIVRQAKGRSAGPSRTRDLGLGR
jgi:hypothetical protein